MQILHRMWKDEAGFVVSTELVLVATILVIGMVVGLTTVRNAVTQELGDVGLAIGSLNQSFEWEGAAALHLTDTLASVDGSVFADKTDVQDGADIATFEPAGISVLEGSTPEGS